MNKQKIDVEDGVYNALWSGYNMKIMIPHKENIYVDTVIENKGFNRHVFVEIKDGKLNILSLFA